MTLDAARTIAFDVFDLNVIQFEGSAERIYEDVTLVQRGRGQAQPASPSVRSST